MPPTAPFPTELTDLAAFAKALGHPARLAILRTLAERGTCVCGEVVDVLPLAQATVSQHLKVLKDAGLVRGETDGPRSCYCLDPDAVARLADAIAAFTAGLRPHAAGEADCC
ncbi:MAG: metalloregulator ArsR/SmtB family transcription factor [Rhodothermales bacterium]